MKNIGLLIVLLAFIFGFASCEKTTIDEETNKPTIHIDKLTDAASYNSGDTVWFNIHFEDKDQLHEYSVEVMNMADSTYPLYFLGHSHMATFELDTYLIPTVSIPTSFKLKTKVSNHNSLSSITELGFNVAP